MESVNRILEVLYDRGGAFVWIDDLVAAAGVLRARLSEAFRALRQRGHEIEQTPTQGVRLVRPTVLDPHLIERDLPVERIGKHAICFAEVDSTNDIAFDSAAGEPLVVTAEFQRAGRGRLGRQWICPPGEGVLASVALGTGAAKLGQEALTIAAGLAVAEGIEAATGVAGALAWPNDVLIDAAKVAGVIVETRPAGGGERRVVIGLGVNAASAPPDEGLHRKATCLVEAVGSAEVERTEVLRAILVRLDHWLGQIRRGLTGELHDCWVVRCGMMNRRVTVRCGEQVFTGRVLDVSPLEGLILAGDDGEQVHLSAATSSLAP